MITLAYITHAAGAEYLRRSVTALRAQTVRDGWEVVVGVDARDEGDAELVRDLLRPERMPFPCRVVGAVRPVGPDAGLAHRNRARNAAARAGSGDVVWPLDGDVVLEPHAVEHVLATRADCVSPLCSAPELGGRSWFRDFADPLRAFAVTRPARGPRWWHGPPSSVRYPVAHEGFPTVPRAVFEALGGFDERFVGYGGNKYELVCRLAALEKRGLLTMRLLTSVRCLHQPHDSDHSSRAKESRLLADKLRDMRRGAPWWLEQVSGVARLSGRPSGASGRPAGQRA